MKRVGYAGGAGSVAPGAAMAGAVAAPAAEPVSHLSAWRRFINSIEMLQELVGCDLDVFDDLSKQ